MHRFLRMSGLLLAMVFLNPAFAWTTLSIQTGQTIDGIAAKYRPNGVTPMDMVIALRSANPGLGKGLKTGTKLRIPTTPAEVREAITGQAAPTPAPVKTIAVAKPTAVPKAVAPKKTVAKAVAKPSVVKQQQAPLPPVAPVPPPQIAAKAETVGQSPGFFSFGALWFVLWLVTLFLLWRERRKNRAPVQPERPSAVVEPSIKPEVVKEEPLGPIETAHKQIEPSLQGLPESEEKWRQVELDIPVGEAPTQTHIRLEPALSIEEQEELVGEQQQIINAIAQDHDNTAWHIALLEFYVKTTNEGGFARHVQTMIRTGLMSEGDHLWEKIRKMYLNGWIYKEEI